MNNLFIFDLDDTLIVSEFYYNLAIVDFLRYTLVRLSSKCPDIPYVAKKFERLDRKQFANVGTDGDRFQLSLAITYRQICRKLRITDPEGEQALLRIGDTALASSNWMNDAFYPGAIETLDYLTLQQDHLALLTWGDFAVQQGKINAAGIKRWFNPTDILITQENKTARHMLNIAAGYDPRRVFMVGNSKESDVRPAIEAGINVIYIPGATWHYDRNRAKLPEYEYLRKFDTISDIVSKYAELTKVSV